MRLIDADELIEWLKLTCSSPCNCDTCDDRGSKTCIQCVTEWALNKAPSVDLVRYGKWKDNGIGEAKTCSVCGNMPLNVGYHFFLSKYCPWCGAKMEAR